MKVSAWLMAVVCLLLASCDGSIVYHHYVDVAHEGLEKSDSLVFDVDTLKADGMYDIALCLRTDSRYPYSKLVMNVGCTVTDGDGKSRSTQQVVDCVVRQSDGTVIGQGTVCYANEYPVQRMNIRKGSTLRIVAKHGMRRDVMPGVVSMGVKISK